MPAFNINQLPEGCYITIKDNEQDEYTVYYSDSNHQNFKINGKDLGALTIGKSRGNISGLVFEIIGVQTQSNFGPLLYDTAMELVNKITNGKGYLKSDPNAVSRFAINVWDHYFKRDDINKKPMDSLENEVTPTKLDNVGLQAAKEIYGNKPKLPGNAQPWYNKPLSTGYQKNIQILNSDKILYLENKITKIEFILNEGRRQIKTAESTKILTKYIVGLLKYNIQFISKQIKDKNDNDIKLEDKDFPLESIQKLKDSLNIDEIVINIKLINSRLGETIHYDSAGFLVGAKSLYFNFLFNKNYEFIDILAQMKDLVLKIKSVVEHELTHVFQTNKGPVDQRNKLYNVDYREYDSILISNINRFLIKEEIQAYVRGAFKYHKWPKLFYVELNSFIIESMMENSIKEFKHIFNKKISQHKADINEEMKTVRNKCLLLSKQVFKFKTDIIIYIKQHYRKEINFDENQLYPKSESECYKDIFYEVTGKLL